MQRPENSAAPPTKRRRQTTSLIWNDFDRVEIAGQDRAICKHCQRNFSGSSKNGTTNLANHLKRCSPIKSKESRKEMNSVFDEEKSSLDVVRMIIKHGYPLNMIEHERFSIFVENLQPRFKLPSRDTLKAGILRVYGEEKEKLWKYFEKLSCRFHLILNFLTSHDKKNRYCCFTLQFSEDGLKLKKKILALKSLENCPGETHWEMVKDQLGEWKIDKKLYSITVEHSSSNKKMVHNLDTWLDLQRYPPHKRTLLHIPCITHIINLLVQDGLDEIVLILHKIRKAIKYLSETANGAQKFQEVDLTSQRWDSVFFMLQSALKYKEIFPYQQSGASDFPINISMEEWESAEAILKCLTFFYDVVQRFLGSKCFITNLYFSDICNIDKFLLKWQKSEQAFIRSIANKMKARYDNYCRDFIRVSAIAAVFDPWSKLEFVLFSLKNVYGEGTTLCTKIKDDFFRIFDGYAEDFSSQPYRSSSSYGNNDCDVLGEWYESKRDSQREELDRYLKAPASRSEELDVLGWWHTNGKEFPTLWRMSRDILAIPMSTSISNSAFYIEPMTINSIFNGLDPDIVEATTCGGDWLDNPIRITPNKDNDHSPEPTYSPSVFAGTSSSLETQEKHAPFTADTVLKLGNPGSTSCPEPLPTRDTFLDLSGCSLSLEPQLQEKHNSSTANAEPMLENRGTISGPEPLPTYVIPFVLESQQKHNSPYANTRLLLENIGTEPPPARDTSLDLVNSSLSLEPQPQEKHNSSTANAEPMLENRGSISGPAPHAFVLEPQQKHNSPNANTRPLLENIGSTSGPEPLPDGTAPEEGEILRRNEAQGLQHNSMRSQECSWSPPPSGWFKFNVGAAVCNPYTFVAVVERNDVGDVIEAFINRGNVTGSLGAEALAFNCAVHCIKQWSVRKAIIEGDAPSVVDALKDRNTEAPTEINDIVQDAFAVLDTCTDTIVDFSCVNKSCNSLAYDCLKWATRDRFFGSLMVSWFNGTSFIGPSRV